VKGTVVGVGAIRTKEEARRFELGEAKRSERRFKEKYKRMVVDHERLRAQTGEGGKA
jgi:hypothetical protein